MEEAPARSETDWYDPYKLAQAIASHETGWFTTGVGVTHNNGCGIRRNGDWMRYESKEASLEDCVSVVEKYRPWTISQIAQRWTTTEREFWINNVTYFYNLNN